MPSPRSAGTARRPPRTRRTLRPPRGPRRSASTCPVPWPASRPFPRRSPRTRLAGVAGLGCGWAATTGRPLSAAASAPCWGCTRSPRGPTAGGAPGIYQRTATIQRAQPAAVPAATPAVVPAAGPTAGPTAGPAAAVPAAARRARRPPVTRGVRGECRRRPPHAAPRGQRSERGIVRGRAAVRAALGAAVHAGRAAVHPRRRRCVRGGHRAPSVASAHVVSPLLLLLCAMRRAVRCAPSTPPACAPQRARSRRVRPRLV